METTTSTIPSSTESRNGDYRDLAIADFAQQDGRPDDLVINMLTEENTDLRITNRQLVDLVADLAFDLEVARQFADRQYRARVAHERGATAPLAA